MEQFLKETKEEAILKFIEMFQTGETIQLFTNGMCYWFSVILVNRFSNSKIVYDCINGHFLVEIDKLYYDITGKVILGTTTGLIYWDSYDDDDTHKKRIIRDVIIKQSDI